MTSVKIGSCKSQGKKDKLNCSKVFGRIVKGPFSIEVWFIFNSLKSFFQFNGLFVP
jgi:hypothetical protein